MKPLVHRPAARLQSQHTIMSVVDNVCRGQVVTGGRLLSRSTVTRCWSSLSLKRTRLKRLHRLRQLPPALTQTKLTNPVTGWLTPSHFGLPFFVHSHLIVDHRPNTGGPSKHEIRTLHMLASYHAAEQVYHNVCMIDGTQLFCDTAWCCGYCL